jgi:L-aspartate oxidase
MPSSGTGAAALPSANELLAGPDALDVLVVGSGVAGLTAALALAGRRRVAVIAKEARGGGSTALAQGGLAAALWAGDTAAAHAADTVSAAAGLGDPAVAQLVTGEAAEAVAMLAELGVRFDTGAPAREGGHRVARIVHALGDATGAEISRALVAAAAERDVALLEGMFLVDLLTSPDGGTVTGALVWDGTGLRRVSTSTVLLATGGYARLWACTTNPRACVGDGLAAALRAGAQVADLEFVQFHPTGMDLGTDPRPLASEAVRGAGARLRGADGEYLNKDASADLAPRDVVSRAMAQRMAELRADHCYLDTTLLGEATLEAHFPTFVSFCRAAGKDPAREWLPVGPTAHYTMGGVLADCDGRTTLEGLMAVGEVASSGLHGANRLASNSLLEGAVIGSRAARAIVAANGPVPPLRPVEVDEELALVGGSGRLASRAVGHQVVDRAGLRAAMQAHAGVCRDGDGLAQLAGHLAGAGRDGAGGPGWGTRFIARGDGHEPAGHGPVGRAEPQGPEGWELANMVLLARTVTALAARRCESRGAHWRSDYPSTHADWRARQVVQRLPSGEMGVGNLEVSGSPVPAQQEEGPAGAPALHMAGAREAAP